MKKKKLEKQIPAIFENHPFKSLKGLTPPPPPGAGKRAQSSRKKEPPAGDDEELFLRAVAGARRMDQKDVAATPVREAAPVPSDAPSDSRLFLQAMKKLGTAMTPARREPEEPADTQRRSPTGRMRQLKRGSLRVSGELDLHGFLRDEALVLLERFITGAFGRGQEAVLVITGKGINSPEGPVLQGAVAGWLRQQGKGMVAEFSPAPRDKGGSGAFVVFLKKS